MDIVEYIKSQQQKGGNNLDPNRPFESTFYKQGNLKYDDYKDYIDIGHFDPFDKPKMDKMRAENQGFGEQLWRRAVNIPNNIITGFVRDAGYLGTLATEWGEDRDYTNALTEWADRNRDWLGGEVYRENPDKVIDIYDSAFWLDTLSQVFESSMQFGAEAIATAGVINPIASGLAKIATKASKASKLANLVAKGSRAAKGVESGLSSLGGFIGKKAPQVANSALLGYFENAQQGGETYKKIYEDLSTRFPSMPEEEKKRIAVKGASTSVQVGTAIQTVLNFGILESLYAPAASLKDLQKSGIFTRGAKSAQAFKEGLETAKTSKAVSAFIKGETGLKSYGIEGGKEALEELFNTSTPLMGQRIAEREVGGEETNFLDGLAEMNQFFKDINSEEGLLAAASGFFGGTMQKLVIERNPFKKHIKYDENGKPIALLDKDGNDTGKFVKERMSETAYGRRERSKMYDEYKNTVLSDIERSTSLIKQIKVRTAEGASPAEIEGLKRELFDIKSYHSVVKGTTEHLLQDFKEIAEVDNTIDLGVEAKKQADAAQVELNKAREQVGDKPTKEQQDALAQMALNVGELNKQALQLSGQTKASLMGFVTKDGTGINPNNPLIDNSYKKRAEQSIKDLREAAIKYDEFQNKYGYGDYATYRVPEAMFRSWLDKKRATSNFNDSNTKLEQEKAVIKERMTKEGFAPDVIDKVIKEKEYQIAGDIKQLIDEHGKEWTSLDEINAIANVMGKKAAKLQENKDQITADYNEYKNRAIQTNEVVAKQKALIASADALTAQLKSIQESNLSSEEKITQMTAAREAKLKEIAGLEEEIEKMPASKYVKSKKRLVPKESIRKKIKLTQLNKDKETLEAAIAKETDTKLIEERQKELAKVQKEIEDASAEFEALSKEYKESKEEFLKEESKQLNMQAARESLDKQADFNKFIGNAINDEGLLEVAENRLNSLQTNSGLNEYTNLFKKGLQKQEEAAKKLKKEKEDEKKIEKEKEAVKAEGKVKEAVTKEEPKTETRTEEVTPDNSTDLHAIKNRILKELAEAEEDGATLADDVNERNKKLVKAFKIKNDDVGSITMVSDVLYWIDTYATAFGTKENEPNARKELLLDIADEIIKSNDANMYGLHDLNLLAKIMKDLFENYEDEKAVHNINRVKEAVFSVSPDLGNRLFGNTITEDFIEEQKSVSEFTESFEEAKNIEVLREQNKLTPEQEQVSFNKIIRNITTFINRKKLETGDIHSDFINTFNAMMNVFGKRDWAGTMQRDLGLTSGAVDTMRTLFPYVKEYFKARENVAVVDKSLIDGYMVDNTGKLVNTRAAINTGTNVAEEYDPADYDTDTSDQDYWTFKNELSTTAAATPGTDWTQFSRERKEDAYEGSALESNLLANEQEVKFVITDDDSINVTVYENGEAVMYKWGEAKEKFGKNSPEWIMNNIPIKIIGGTGGDMFVHSLEWVNAKNIAVEKNPANLAAQRKAIKELRKDIVQNGVRSGKLKLISNGFINRTLGEAKGIKEMMPNLADNLENNIGIVNNGTITFADSSEERLVPKHTISNDPNALKLLEGAVVVMIPCPDGISRPFPLIRSTIAEAGQVKTLLGLMQHLLEGHNKTEITKEIKKLILTKNYSKNDKEAGLTYLNRKASTIDVEINKEGTKIRVIVGGTQFISSEQFKTVGEFISAISGKIGGAKLNVDLKALNRRSKEFVRVANEDGTLANSKISYFDLYTSNLKTKILEKKLYHSKEAKGNNVKSDSEGNKYEPVYFNNPLREILREKNNINVTTIESSQIMTPSAGVQVTQEDQNNATVSGDEIDTDMFASISENYELVTNQIEDNSEQIKKCKQ